MGAKLGIGGQGFGGRRLTGRVGDVCGPVISGDARFRRGPGGRLPVAFVSTTLQQANGNRAAPMSAAPEFCGPACFGAMPPVADRPNHILTGQASEGLAGAHLP